MTLRIDTSGPKGIWTDEQWHAIHTQGAHLLVSAAAGAGKTAVLVERIIQRVLRADSPCDIDRLLVVTFTEAAAAQMRERIARRLTEAAEDPARPGAERARLRQQITLLDRAFIQTLHGFCLWLLRRYFYLLEIDPLFRVLDGEEATLLKYETVDRLLEEEYEKAGPGSAFYLLVDAFRDARGDATIRTALVDLYDYAASLPDPEGWFSHVANLYRLNEACRLDDTVWAKVVIESVATDLLMAAARMTRAVRLAEVFSAPPKAQLQLREECTMLQELAEHAAKATWQDLYERFETPPAFRTLRFDGFADDIAKEKIREEREQAKRVLNRIAREVFCHAPGVELDRLRQTEPYVQEILRLVRAFSERYRKIKRMRGVVDFSDLERFALEILQHGAEGPGEVSASEELRAYFEEVLVDEYQDINPLQDAIIAHVCRPSDSDMPNLFMVGDVKQSIYRFRLADPTLFLHRMERFAPFERIAGAAGPGQSRQPSAEENERLPGVVINLRANFRSRRSILDGVNFLFRQVLTPRVGELAYDERAELVAGAGYPVETDVPVELHILERDADRIPASSEDEVESDDEGEVEPDMDRAYRTALEREAERVALLAKELLDAQTPVLDKEAKSTRPIRPRDIVVLLRSTKERANLFVEAFRTVGLPAHAELGTGFFQAVEVETMLSVLRIIDNPRQDIPLAAVLRAPWVDLSTLELARIRIVEPTGDLYDAVRKAADEFADDPLGKKLRRFCAQLDEWRTMARRATLGDLLQHLYSSTGYLEFVQGLPGGAQRYVNLQALLERAARFDGFTQGGLTRFLRFVDSLQEEEGDLGEAPVLGEGDDVIRIMSIHKSKGLQFPVVFVADLGKAFNLSDRSGSILYHGALGIAPQWADAELGLRAKTLAHRAVSEMRRREAIAEELRILYVALTRAEERLVLVGSVKDVWRTAAKWSQAADVEGWELPDHLLARGSSFLDWIGPAVMRHADGAPLRDAAERESGAKVEVRDREVFGDGSRWQVTLWPLEGGANRRNAEESESLMSDPIWQRLVRGDPLGRSIDPSVASQLEEALGGRYPFVRSTVAPAKVSVTWLAREVVEESGGVVLLQSPNAGERDLAAMRSSDENELEMHEAFRSPLRRPAFVEEETAPTPAELGTAMHTLLYHLDLQEHRTEEAVRTFARRLAERSLISRAQLERLDFPAVVHFLGSPLASRIARAGAENLLWREWAFTWAVPLGYLDRLLRAEPSEEGDASDRLLIQGTVDLLWLENERLYLLDYKTDRVNDPDALCARYETQLRIYKEAVEELTNLQVGGAYLVHLRSQSTVIELPL